MVSRIGHEHAAAYAHGELDPDDAERFETHLAGCPPCLAKVDEIAGITDSLADIDPHQPPPPGGLSRLRRAIADERRRTR